MKIDIKTGQEAAEIARELNRAISKPDGLNCIKECLVFGPCVCKPAKRAIRMLVAIAKAGDPDA